MSAMRQALCLPFPLGHFMVQLVVPRDMTQAEADRICAFVQSLAVPWAKNAGAIEYDSWFTHQEPGDACGSSS